MTPSKTLPKPFQDPSKTLQRPLQKPLLGSGGSVAGNESLDATAQIPSKEWIEHGHIALLQGRDAE